VDPVGGLSRTVRRSEAWGNPWFTVAEHADRATVAAVYRGVLVAQRHRLADVMVDVVSDAPWPGEVAWAVTELELRRRSRRSLLRPWRMTEPDISVELDPRVDEQFALAVAVAPYTLSGVGISDEQTMIWDVNDTGTSATFELEDRELKTVRAYVAANGGVVDDLVPFDRHRPWPS